MKKNWLYFLGSGLVLVLCLGVTSTLFFNKTEAQNTRSEKVWKKTDHPLKSINSQFRLNLSSISESSDWVIGIKPIQGSGNEKMYVGIVTWGIDSNDINKKFKIEKIINLEDYPLNDSDLRNGVVEGVINLSKEIKGNQTLVIYLEVAPSVETFINKQGSELSSKVTDNSFAIFNGKEETFKVENVSSLISFISAKKADKALIEGMMKKEVK